MVEWSVKNELEGSGRCLTWGTNLSITWTDKREPRKIWVDILGLQTELQSNTSAIHVTAWASVLGVCLSAFACYVTHRKEPVDMEVYLWRPSQINMEGQLFSPFLLPSWPCLGLHSLIFIGHRWITPPEIKRPKCKIHHSPHPVLRLRIRGAISPLTPTS
jgi:hypothetical protein